VFGAQPPGISKHHCRHARIHKASQLQTFLVRAQCQTAHRVRDQVVQIDRRILQSWLESWGYRLTMLLVTSRDGAADVVAGLEAGADDYLTKPFERNELRARLTVGRPILALQDGLIRAREELRFQATHDVLTGIWNRRALPDLLQRELERASRSSSSTALLMLNLDHLIRSYDFVGRYGSEEFLVVLPGCDRIHAFQSAERIRAAVAAAPISMNDLQISVTASIGVTAVAPKRAKNNCSRSLTLLSIRPSEKAGIAPPFSNR